MTGDEKRVTAWLDPNIYYESASARLGAQLDSIDAIDAKLTTVVTTTLAEVALLAALLTLKVDAIRGLDRWPFWIAGITGIGTAILCIAGLWAHKWSTYPSAAEVWEEYDPTGDGRLQIGATLSQAVEDNKGCFHKKASILRAGFCLLTTQTILFAWGAAIVAKVI